MRILDRLLFVVRFLPRGRFRESLETSLRGLPEGHSEGCRASQINAVADSLFSCEDYLEIGVQYGFTLASVRIPNKTGVDPMLKFNPRLSKGVDLHRTTSDEFFYSLPASKKFDLIYLDGLHTYEQTARDFHNSLRHLRSGGAIVIDDVVPESEAKALPDRLESLERQRQETGLAEGDWYGDVWKLTVAISHLYGESLEITTHGFGPCGQAVVRDISGNSVRRDIPLGLFWQFGSLKFADFFPPSGEIRLPGYRKGTL